MNSLNMYILKLGSPVVHWFTLSPHRRKVLASTTTYLKCSVVVIDLVLYQLLIIIWAIAIYLKLSSKRIYVFVFDLCTTTVLHLIYNKEL